MRRSSEFATWLAARWPSLVRTLVFLGHPRAEAEEIVLEGVARALPDWEQELHEGDPEVLTYRVVLEHRERVVRHHPSTVEAAAEPLDLPPALADRLERRRELEAHLRGLPEPARERAVLFHVAELSEDQVADVLGAVEPPPSLPLASPDVRDACEAVPVGPAPVADVLARARSRRRTVRVRLAAAVALLAVVAGGATWWATRAEGPQQGEVLQVGNPLPIPWYADGRLHLARVTVEVSGLVQLVEVPDGVVYSDEEGYVVRVDSAGDLTTIGRTVVGTRVVSDRDLGWTAWADPGTGSPELVVHDTVAESEVSRRSLLGSHGVGGQPVGESQPIAIEDERVFYASPDGDFAWEPLNDISFALAGTMLDTAEGARVTLDERGLRLTPDALRTGTVIPAEEASLTRDGRYAFALVDDQLAVYDVETGEPLPLMYPPSDKAVAWSYHEGTFLFALQHNLSDKTYQDLLQMPSEGDYRIYACRPELADPCDRVAEVPEEVPDPPVLAR